MVKRLILVACSLSLTGGCEDQTRTDVTIAPEVTAVAWHSTSSGRPNGTSTDLSLVRYSTIAVDPVSLIDEDTVVVPAATGTAVFVFNQLLNGDSIETAVLKKDAAGKELRAGLGDWKEYSPVVDYWTGLVGLIEVTFYDTATTVSTAPVIPPTFFKRIEYRPDGFFARSYADPFVKEYPPAVTLIFASAQRAWATPSTTPAGTYPNTTLPKGKIVRIDLLASDTGIRGVSNLPMVQAKYSNGTGVTSPSGKPVAATVILKVTP